MNANPEKIKKLTPEEQITLRGFFDSLPSKDARDGWFQVIATNTMTKPSTIRMWIYSKQRPDDLKQSIISKLTGIPVENLFAE